MWKYLLPLTLVCSGSVAQEQAKPVALDFDQQQRKALARGSEANPVSTIPVWVEPHQQLDRTLVNNAFMERQVQLRRDTEKLLALAAELKQNVDKTSPSILSMDVIKKAQEIEKLAKSVKDKMKDAY
jgi:ABC-type histidine transport system ATPase subunit